MSGPTLSEIRLVLTAEPRAEVRARKAVSDAAVNFSLRRNEFTSRGTLAAWARTVTAARRLHREIKAAERRGIAKAPVAWPEEGA
jgi:hypothetical protein